MEKNNSISGINLAKVILTVLVVLGHICRLYGIETTVPPVVESKNAARLCRLIYSFHMPAFIFISGYIYSYLRTTLDKYRSTSSFIVNKFRRLIIPFCTISILWMYPIMTLLNIWDYSFTEWFFSVFITLKETVHLWYVIVLFSLFLIQRIAEIFCSSNVIYCSLPLLFTVSIIGPLVHLPFPFPSLMIYALYFELGCFTGAHSESFYRIIDHNTVRWITPVLFFLLFIIHQYVSTIGINTIARIIYPICASMGIISLLSVCRMIQEKTRIEDKSLFRSVLRNSYGVYLFHPMIVYAIFYVCRDAPISPLALILLTTLVSTAVSYFITVFFRTIHCGWVIGE